MNEEEYKSALHIRFVGGYPYMHKKSVLKQQIF